MRPGDKHKARASREYQKKHGLVPAKQSKKQKEKAAIAKLESNWDRYDDSSEHYGEFIFIFDLLRVLTLGEKDGLVLFSIYQCRSHF